MFSWFDDRVKFMQAIDALENVRRSGETHLVERGKVDGYCACCDRMTVFLVNVGGFYGERPNLREGMVCERCRLSNRNRLIFAALMERAKTIPDVRIALLERLTPLFVALDAKVASLSGSEYLDGDKVGGREYLLKGHPVRHESITSLSYGDASFDLVAHCDVLEHVYDYRTALSEVRRVLKPGGQMICTVPFFMTRGDEAVLARPRPGGNIEFFGPPEYHGDGQRPEGILTFHHFGWKLLADAKAAGFASADIGLKHDLFCGLATNNHPNFDYGVMYPLVLRAIA